MMGHKIMTSTLQAKKEETEKYNIFRLIKVFYMSFDKFLLAVESRDLSQADKSIIRVYSFPKLSNGLQNFFFCLSTTEA